MLPSRITELLAPFLSDAHLADSQLGAISTYIDLLLHWNSRINLTAVRNPEEIVTRHFGESLFAARHIFPLNDTQNSCHPERNLRSAARIADAVKGPAVKETPRSDKPGPNHHDVVLSVEPLLLRKTDSSEGSMHSDQTRHVDLIDLGSGAGFPGLPIKIWAPYLKLTLIESNQKKATFLREVCRATILTDVNVVTSRAEACGGLTAATVTMRAVEHFESALPVARRFLQPGGRLALLIGASQVEPARANLSDLDWLDPVNTPLSGSRCLLIGTWNQEPNL